MSIDPKRTPQEYEILTGGGAESAEVGRRGMDRRQLLRRSVGLSLGLVATAGSFGALVMFYPNLAGKFGSVITLKPTSSYPAAEQAKFQLDQKGIFYEPNAKSYIMHLAEGPDTHFLLSGAPLADAVTASTWVKGSDNTWWAALYQVCVHLGCKVPFRDDCVSFKCPCHGSHYNVDGEYLDGPAPRSLDRFVMTLTDDLVRVDTGKLNQTVQRPDAGTRILKVPDVVCGA
jgi:cytochrome b6-f complex iron-sulfur subunit